MMRGEMFISPPNEVFMLFQKKNLMPKPFRKGLTPFIVGMLAVPVLWFFIFYVAVNFNSIIMAFREIAGIGDDGKLQYIWGLGNFEKFFRELTAPNVPGIRVAFFNTLKYFSLNFFVTIPLTYFVSYFMYKKIKGYKFFRVLFYSPQIISATAMVIIYKNIIGGYGPLYELVKLFGGELPALLTYNATATPTILIYTLWVGFGVNIVLYQGAMGRLPEDVLEAGRIDGISWWRELFSVILPMCWGTISTTLLFAVTGLFNASGPILLFGMNGQFETTTINFYIFQQVHDQAVYNYPAAIGLFFTLVNIPIVFGFRWLINKVDPEVEY